MPVFSLELPKTEGGLPVKITNGDAKKDSMEFIDNLDTYGTYKFKGKVAAPYLKAQGLPVDTLDNPMWTHTLSDKVAKAVVEWCKAKGATMATHWFQPLGSAGVRRAPCPTQPPRGLGRCGRQRPWLGQRQIHRRAASSLGQPRPTGRRVPAWPARSRLFVAVNEA